MAAKIGRYRNTHSGINLIFFENTCEVSDAQGLFPLFVFEVEIILHAKRASLPFVELSAACPLCLHGSAEKI